MDSEDEAEALLVLTCPRNIDGDFVAVELAEEQSLENLQAFSDKLARAYELIKRRRA